MRSKGVIAEDQVTYRLATVVGIISVSIPTPNVCRGWSFASGCCNRLTNLFYFFVTPLSRHFYWRVTTSLSKKYGVNLNLTCGLSG